MSKKGVRLSPPTLMKSAFKNEKLPKTLRLEAKISGDVKYNIDLRANEFESHIGIFSEACELGSTRVFGQSSAGARVMSSSIPRTSDRQRSLWDKTRAVTDYPRAVIAALEGVGQYAIYAPQTEFLREVRSGKVASPPVGLHGEGLAQAVYGLISHWATVSRSNKGKISAPENVNYRISRTALDLTWLPGWTSGFRVGEISPLLRSSESIANDGQLVYFVDRFMHEKRNTLSAYDSSEGTLFLLFLAVLLAHPESPRIFALDNVDNALNPLISRKMIEKVIDIVKLSNNENYTFGPKQVLFTSHNPSVLDAFDLFDDDVRVFVVSRNETGHSNIRRLQPAKGWSREKWQEAFGGRKLSQLWIDGEISGALGGKEDI